MKVRMCSALGGASKLAGVMTLSAVLVACGGGTSGDTDDGLGTTDGFGELDSGETAGTTGEFGENTTDFGSEIDPDDLNDNGIPDANEQLVCQGLGGSDPSSNNESWTDNCWLDYDIERDDGDEVTRSPFWFSSYVQGVQRILYCREAAGTASSIDAWSDGKFGINTFNAIVALQQAEGIPADGRVGPQTWTTLQGLVDDAALIVEEDSDVNYDAFGIARVAEPTTEIDCSQQTNFFGRLATEAGAEDFYEGWEMSTLAGQNVKGVFSIQPPSTGTAAAE